jgi:hypothetical protein
MVGRLRFEEFVKGFLSMSVFHTAECWVTTGSESLEQVGWGAIDVCSWGFGRRRERGLRLLDLGCMRGCF